MSRYCSCPATSTAPSQSTSVLLVPAALLEELMGFQSNTAAVSAQQLNRTTRVIIMFIDCSPDGEKQTVLQLLGQSQQRLHLSSTE